jgi:DNA-binding SARP family transcriptional activator
MTALTFGLLGPVQVHQDGLELTLGGTKQRTVLALLALNVGRVVGADQLVSALWGSDIPEKAAGTLQVYASNLRRVLGEANSDGAQLLSWRRPGYLLDVDPASVDLVRFDRLVGAAREQRDSGELTEASRLLGEALALWRGSAIADLASEPFAGPVVVRLDGARRAAIEERVDLDLALGRHQQLIAELQALVLEQPLHERFWGFLMLAQYRAGRQADALASYRQARDTLADQLGIDPGPDLRSLEQAILAQSPALSLGPAPAVTSSREVTERWERPEQPPRAWLQFPRGERVPITAARVVIGRANECDVVVHDKRASRRHAVIRATETGDELVDLDSSNGTAVNNAELGPRVPHPLVDGDEIEIGTSRLIYTTQSV